MKQTIKDQVRPGKQVKQYQQAGWLFFLVIGVCCLVATVSSVKAGVIDTSNDRWAVLGGYGQSFPGWGQTVERVETLDIIPRYSHLIFDNAGSGWYQGYHSVVVELPVHVVVSHDVSAMAGVNFLGCYTFTANEQKRPYLFAGGGPLYSFADIPGMGADWNGNYQAGLGLEYLLAGGGSINFEFRYHHVSNGGSQVPNEPLNSLKFIVGVTF